MANHRRATRVNRHFRIDDELKREDREAYRAYVLEPGTTNKSAHAWLAGRGYTTFSESAVARHRRFYLARFAEDTRAAECARNLAAFARDTPADGGDVLAGAVVLSEVKVVEQLFGVGGRRVTDEELDRFGDLVSRMVNTRLAFTKLGAAARKRAAPADDAPPAPPASEEERREATMKKVCEILKQPYRTPEQRAASAKAWEEFERRRQQGDGAPSEN